MAERKVLPCLALAEGEIAPRVITCGDPARAERIAGMLDNSKCLAKNREFWTFTGEYKGVPVTVSSHGVGCGGAAILFESLYRAGAKVIIRVGTCGSMQKGMRPGSLVIATAACREDGVTEKMVPLAYPAVSDVDVVCALKQAAAKTDADVHAGIAFTNALFYPGLLESKIQLYAKAGCKAMDNEIASLLVVASIHGIKAGAIVAVDAPAFGLVDVEEYQPDPEMMKKATQDEIEIALEAIVNVSLD